ncbi:MAG: lipoprotein signal peptidase [Gallionellaceae bacterium CG02_land_8_20_14_3_00_60_115]|nr:MAG: lipoprotein signal peptidase [Gallionellaceae bacterium CG02_land_8_20_14_3_00_60_115]
MRETPNKCLRGRIAALRGARQLAYLFDMSRCLRSVRLVLHPARRFLQRFPSTVQRRNPPAQ